MSHTFKFGSQQRGIAAVMAVIFLVAAVVFVLAQTLGITGTSSIDNKLQMDSTAAFFLAESGIENGQVSISNGAGTMSNSTCTGVAASAALGRGTYTLSGVSTPATCNQTGAGGAPVCTSCALQSIGAVGNVSRTVNRAISLTTINGVAGTGTSVSMILKNTYGNSAVALFNLATRRTGSDTDTTCNSVTTTNGGTATCSLKWNVQSQNGGGTNSVGGMGVTVIIPATDSATISQTLDSSRSYAEVGVLFPGSVAPSVVGAYWDDSNGGGSGTGTVSNSASTGTTNDGAACSTSAPVSASCPATTTPPSPIPNSGTSQASKSWCYGGNTLIFGFTGRTSALADNPLSAVSFNTNGHPSQNISLTKLVHFPDSSYTSATGDVYSDIYYARNSDYLSVSSGAGATSYPTAVLGTVGATFNATLANHSTAMTVNSFTAGQLCYGDKITGSNKLGGTGNSSTISTGGPIATTSSCSSATGSSNNYVLADQSSGNDASATLTAASTTFTITATTGTNLSAGSATSTTGTTVTVASSPGGATGNATLSAAATVNSGASTAFYQGSSGTTIKVPSGGTAPTAGTIVAVYTGTGQFAAQTTVSSSPAPTATSFTVSATPTTPLVGAVVCGGTCAYFDHTQSTTQFTVTTTGTSQWSSGFLCLSGADITPVVVQSLKATATTWSETVQ